MATTKNPGKALMGSFKELGMTAAQVRHFVPGWWDDEAANDEGGLLELQILLARRLNVSLATLQAPTPKPEFREAARRFKTVHPQGSAQLAVSAGVGHGFAHVLAAATSIPLRLRRLSPAHLRAALLKRKSSVTLDVLCTWLWEQGVPVVHITNWPRQLRRPDAMCLRVGNRPVILIVRNETAPARLTYLVAHELGHVMAGHLKVDNNEVLVDDTLPVDDQGFANDEDEKIADAYALELLGGDALRAASKSLATGYLDEMKLVLAAMGAAKDKGLDAGQVILSWARLTGEWKTAGMGLRYLMTSGAARLVINDAAKEFLDIEELSGDNQEHLARLTGIDFS